MAEVPCATSSVRRSAASARPVVPKSTEPSSLASRSQTTAGPPPGGTRQISPWP
jgi:hypothetical protein